MKSWHFFCMMIVSFLVAFVKDFLKVGGGIDCESTSFTPRRKYPLINWGA